MKECKWLSDDFSEICCNADCYICSGYCPFHNSEERKLMCKFFEEDGQEMEEN